MLYTLLNEYVVDDLSNLVIAYLPDELIAYYHPTHLKGDYELGQNNAGWNKLGQNNAR